MNGKDGFVASARFLPKILEEQESLDEWADLDKQFVDGNVKRIYIWDGAGHEWSASSKDMMTLTANIKKFADVPNERPSPKTRYGSSVIFGLTDRALWSRNFLGGPDHGASTGEPRPP